MARRVSLANSRSRFRGRRASQEPALAQLAQRIAAAVRGGARTGADPFEKVKSLISGMIEKLEKEAGEDSAAGRGERRVDAEVRKTPWTP